MGITATIVLPNLLVLLLALVLLQTAIPQLPLQATRQQSTGDLLWELV
mgnify:CR=1 FL=1